MFSAFSRAFSQLGDPALRRVVIIGIAGSLIVYGAIFFAAYAFFEVEGYLDSWWAGPLLSWAGIPAFLFFSWFFFPATVTLIVSFFLESVAQAVEARYYPELPPPRRQTMGDIGWTTTRFMVLAVALNILALPIFLVFFFLPPINFFVFYALNGYLLGREYFELVALRRIEPRRARAVRGTVSGRLFAAGVLIALMMTVPILNLVTPVIATGAMVHLVEAWRRREGEEDDER